MHVCTLDARQWCKIQYKIEKIKVLEREREKQRKTYPT